MKKLTPQQIEQVISRLTTETIGVIRFGRSGSYESVPHSEIAQILGQVGDEATKPDMASILTEADLDLFKRKWNDGERAEIFKGRLGNVVVAEVESRIARYEALFAKRKRMRATRAR